MTDPADDGDSLYLYGMLRSSYYCGWSWAVMIRMCEMATPCPSGLNTECPRGQKCFSDTPCASLQTSLPTREPTPPPVPLEARAYYCGYSWDWVVNNCARATPCPYGDADGVCPSGMKCIADTPCWAAGMPSRKPTPFPTRGPTRPPFPLVTQETETYYCGFDWNWVVNNCARATPCPGGDASGVCPSGMKCIADTPCWALNNGLPTRKPTRFPTRGPTLPPLPLVTQETQTYFCGYDWDWVVNNCARTIPCPGGDASGVCPSGMKCIADTPCWALNNGMPTKKPSRLPTRGPTFPPVEEDDPNKRFCGYDWTDVDRNCLTAVACPGGYAQGVCPYRMKCIAETRCSDATYLNWLRAEQASNGAGREQQQQSVIAENNKPSSPSATVSVPGPPNSDNGSTGNQCDSNDDCQTNQFCNQPDPNTQGHCGECLHNGIGCSTEQVCRIATGCYQNVQPVDLIAKCYDRSQLDRNCQSRLNNGSAYCDVDKMVCEISQTQYQEQAQSDFKPAESTITGTGYSYCTWSPDTLCFASGWPKCCENGGADCPRERPGCEVRQPQQEVITESRGPDMGLMTQYQNPEGNRFFCGAVFLEISKKCLQSKPCPGGFSSDVCANHEGCFSVPECAAQYASTTAMNNGPAPSPTLTLNPSKSPTPSPIRNLAFASPPFKNEPTAPVNTPSADITSSPTKTPTTSMPSRAPTVNTNFCGISWKEHIKDCANSTPCPNGSECPPGESCFNGSPCALPEEVSESNIGSFCGTEWNSLMLTCKSATKCPNGDECNEGEICYRDFECNPQLETMAPTTTTPITTSTAPLPTKAPITPSPSKSPTVNTNFCGISWEEHAKDCANSTPCPNGNECAPGESCFNGSPCALPEDVSESNTGSFCGTEWNSLISTCKSATKCPNGDECVEGEICYHDFYCNPLPPAVATASDTERNPSSAEVYSPSSSEPCDICGNSGEIDWEERVTFEGSDISCGEFGWIFSNKNIMKGSDRCLGYRVMYIDQCCKINQIAPTTSQTAASSEGPCNICDQNSEIQWEERVTFEGNDISCGEFGWIFSNKIFEGSDECLGYRLMHKERCCKTNDSPSRTSQMIASSESCNICGSSAEIDWESRVDYDGNDISCGEFGWIFSNKILEGSEECLDYRAVYSDTCCRIKSSGTGCDICDTGIVGRLSDIRETGTVKFERDDLSCAEVRNRISTSFDPSNAQCTELKNVYAESCCFQKCILCEDSNLDWEATVKLSGRQVPCHEVDNIFREKEISVDSSRCEMSKSFYAETCCIRPPEQPCNLCSLNGIDDWMQPLSNFRVSYGGELKSCLELYHLLYSRREQFSKHCTDTQRELFDLCCESGAGEIAWSPPTKSPSTQKPTSTFDSWYTASLRSPASTFMLSAWSPWLLVANGLIFMC